MNKKNKMTEKLKAKELHHFYYCLLMEYGGNLSEEITVSVLAIKCSIRACEEVIRHSIENDIDRNFYLNVVTELKKM